MKYKKSVIEVKIRLDPIPGWGHEPEDHIEHLKDLLRQSIAHYNPSVRLLKVEDAEEDPMLPENLRRV